MAAQVRTLGDSDLPGTLQPDGARQSNTPQKTRDVRHRPGKKLATKKIPRQHSRKLPPFDNSQPVVVVLLFQGERPLRKFSIAVIAGTLLLSACSMAGSLKSKDVIKGAIEAHLRDNPHLSMKNFNTEIESVQFKDDTADALVKFVSKADSTSAVEVRYQLKLDGRMWKVVSSQPVGGQGMGGHGGAMGTMPPGHPAVPQGQGQTAPEASH
jgi:hypothetical protein